MSLAKQISARLATGILAAVAFTVVADGRTRTIDFTKRRAKAIEGTTFERQTWASDKTNRLNEKSFQFKEWDTHFSSLGQKQSPILAEEARIGNKRFESKIIEKKNFEVGRSDFNQKLLELHQTAGIEMDDRARAIVDQEVYYMMLQQADAYEELGDKVSLKDINRYQFRKNRPDGPIPVRAAGSEDSSRSLR